MHGTKTRLNSVYTYTRYLYLYLHPVDGVEPKKKRMNGIGKLLDYQCVICRVLMSGTQDSYRA